MVATIEYIEQTIANYEAATQANQDTPCREGNVIVITPEAADDVLITADLHGHRRNFNAIKKIAALDQHPRRHLVLQEVCHGGPTYPSNGGCMSHGMLEDVARLKVQYPDRVHFILSNHELAEATDYPILKSNKMLNLMFRLGMQEVYGPAIEKVRKALAAFIRSCPLAVRLPGDVFICHSLPERCDTRGFDTGVFSRPLAGVDFQEHQAVFQMVWGRDYRVANAEAFAKLVKAKILIHGHEPCPEGFQVPNGVQIILDSCTDRGRYLLLRTDESLTHEQLVARIAPLHPPASGS
ncbi:MAG: hypothetical protein K1X74_03195 [Pirellulales bacterium]|nr:hypothetical protein [Pirellulales bacterium]